MSTTVIIALGTNDSPDTVSVTERNVTAIINSVKARGYETVIVVPPNKSEEVLASRNPSNPNENFKAQYDSVKSAAEAAGATVTEGTYSDPEPWHLTASSASSIRNSNPDAIVVGDHNAVRINGFKSTEVCKTESTTGDILKRVEQRMPDPTTGITEDGNRAITITQQDKTLLDMVTKSNEKGYTYSSYYLRQTEPRLTEWSLTQVQYFQAKLLRRNGRLRESSAAGKYQLIKTAMKMAYNYLKLDPKNTRFSEEIQDALMIARLEQVRKYKEWKAGKFPDSDFCIQLAMEFDSVPVPRAIQANEIKQGVPAQNLLAGQSFYTGNFIFTEGHNLKAFMQSLSDLRKSGPGKIYKIDITSTGENAVSPPSGKTYKRTTEVATTGGNRVTGGRRVNTNPNEKVNLPLPESVFSYESIDPHDDRYDFRTGKKVKDIGINETEPTLDNPSYTVKGNDPLFDAGVAPEYNPVATQDVPQNNTLVDFETNELIVTTVQEKKQAANKIIKELTKQGITDKQEQANVLAVVETKSRLSSRTVQVFNNSTVSEIRSEYGSRIADISDTELTNIKQDPTAFYDEVLADVGGSEYQGRGFIQLTGRDNYVEVGNRLDIDLVNNPELAFDPTTSAKITADFYKAQSANTNLKSLRNLFNTMYSFDPYTTADSQLKTKGRSQLEKIQALSDSWLDELQRTDPVEISNSTTNVVQSSDGGLRGVSDKPLPTGRSLPAPSDPLDIDDSLLNEIDSVSDSPYNELLAQEYLGDDNQGNIIDINTGDILGLKPLDSEIEYDSEGNVVLNKAGFEFVGNGSGAIRSV